MIKTGIKISAYFFISLMLLTACGKRNSKATDNKQLEPQVARADLDSIQSRGVLRALVDYSSTSYFLYRGEPMGYEYELLKRYAAHINTDLEVIPVKNMNEVISKLNEGEGDIIAANLTVTKQREEKIDFTEHHTMTRQVLIQRKPPDWRKMKAYHIDTALIRSPYDLIGKEIFVRKNSAFYMRLQHLSEEIGGEIIIREVPGEISTEQLIEMVANGKIDYTIADQNVATINKSYFSNIDINTAISFPKKIAWAVRETSPKLKVETDKWLKKFKKTTTFAVIYNKYFKNTHAYRNRINSDYYSSKTGKISGYDDLIKSYSEELGWDWRLLASLIYKESRFDHKARSWAGAQGLMQLMPATAERFGIDSMASPEQNISAGVHYLIWLDKVLAEHVPDKQERVKFVLGSYNVGYGHVKDAMRLAEKYGDNPKKWDDNVAIYLKNKSNPEYYTDEVVKHGYCRGIEPYFYVKDIFALYEHYSHIDDDETEPQNQNSALTLNSE